MQITRTSPFTGQECTMDIPVTPEQLAQWQSGVLIQVAMPNISAEHREFIKTGITPQEWNNMFGQSHDEDYDSDDEYDVSEAQEWHDFDPDC